MSANQGYTSPGIAGSGAIATGLAAVSTTTADTILLARSEASAWRAEEKVVAACAKIEGGEPSRLRVTTDPGDLADCDVIVEAIVEEVEPKGELLRDDRRGLPERRPRDHDLLAQHRRDRRGGRHRRSSSASTSSTRCRGWSWSRSASPTAPPTSREKALAWCAALGKTAVEVPDQAGFVVNRLLFPYLFDAVADGRADRDGARRGRHLHEARRRPPDGPARPARLRRPRRLQGDRRRPLRRIGRADPRPPPASSSRWSARASWAARAGAGFYTYD